MKLYCTPGGTWAGSEKGWSDAVKAEGLNPKQISRKIVEVPVSKAELMEWLTFHNVNPLAPCAAPTIPADLGNVDIDTLLAGPRPLQTHQVAGWQEEYLRAPIRLQLELATAAIDAAEKRIAPNT